MTGLWRDPHNDFATNAVPKLTKLWKADYKSFKKQLRAELNPSDILKQLCKTLKLRYVVDELSRSGFAGPQRGHRRDSGALGSYTEKHVEIQFSIVLQTRCNGQYLKLKLSKHYSGKTKIHHILAILSI